MCVFHQPCLLLTNVCVPPQPCLLLTNVCVPLDRPSRATDPYFRTPTYLAHKRPCANTDAGQDAPRGVKADEQEPPSPEVTVSGDGSHGPSLHEYHVDEPISPGATPTAKISVGDSESHMADMTTIHHDGTESIDHVEP